MAYPEILDRQFLYNDEDELIKTIKFVLHNDIKFPKIICQKEMNNFYNTIIKEMK